jgi:hypothetical protein
VVRYISALTLTEINRIQPILDAHQLGAYVMYPAFTSGSVNDAAKNLYSGKWDY